MAAHENLNLRQFQFFHGSQTHRFNVGDVIDPRDRPDPVPLEKKIGGRWTHQSAAGHLLDEDMVRNPRLYFTRNKGIAQSYAAQNNAQGRVYQVTPLGPHESDPIEKGTISTRHPVRVVKEL